MSTTLQLSIEFIEYEVTQQRRKYPSDAKDNQAAERLQKAWNLVVAVH